MNPVTAANEARPPREREPRRRFRLGDILLALVLAAAVLTLIILGPQGILDALFSRGMLIIIVVMIAEYLLIKSSDRTRIYRLENQRLRDRNRRLREVARELSDRLNALEGGDDQTSKESRELRKRLEDLRNEIDEAL